MPVSVAVGVRALGGPAESGRAVGVRFVNNDQTASATRTTAQSVEQITPGDYCAPTSGSGGRSIVKNMSMNDPLMNSIFATIEDTSMPESGKTSWPDYPGELPGKTASIKWIEQWTDDFNTSGYASYMEKDIPNKSSRRLLCGGGAHLKAQALPPPDDGTWSWGGRTPPLR